GNTSSSGSGFNSTFASQEVQGLDDVGALQRTQLQYGVNNQQDDNDCDCDLPELDPKLAVEGEQLVYEDGSVQVVLTAVPDSANGIMTITIVGIPATWTVSGDGTYNAATETWTFTTAPGQTFIGGPILTPPADSDVDLNDLLVTVAEYDPNTGQRGSTSTTIDVIVDAVADTPDIDAQDTQGLEDTAVDVHITGAPGDTDGSETIQKFVITGVPNGFSLNHGTDLGGGTWELSATDIQGLKLNAPQNFYGDVPLSVTIHTAETVTDRDFDLTNNTAQATDTLVVTFIPVADPPIVVVDLPPGDECGCPDVDGLVAQVYEDNTINVNFSASHDATATPNETMTVTVSGVDLTKLEAGSFTISGQNGAQWVRVNGTPDNNASFTINLPAGVNYQGSMTFTPKANSDIDLHDINVTATAHEPASNTSADAAPVEFNVIVDAVADKPVIDAQDAVLSTGQSTIPLNIVGGLGDDKDGSESITHYQIKGVPNGFTFNQGTDLGGGVWQFTPAQLNGLTITSQDPSFAGKINLTAVVFNKDNPTDKDFDTTNNTNFNEDEFCVTWNAPPDAVNDKYCLVEAAIGKGNMNLLSGGATLIKTGSSNKDGHYYKLPLLTNDSDPNGDPLTITKIYNISNPRNNSDISISADGKYIIVRLGQDMNKSKGSTITFDYEITDGNGGYDTAQVCITVKDFISPLVLDLNGNGVELLAGDVGVLFDLDNDGSREQVGWAGPDDGLLAIDVNGDGIINDRSELFGNDDQHADGFANLASYDTNNDGVIDALDGVFANLLVWQDANSDGFSDAGEMFSLSDFDITSISLSATEVSDVISGNVISHTSTFTYTDGSTGTIVDAWFEAQEVVTADDNGVMEGTEYADTFVFEAGDNQSDIVQGFNADEGDVLDISALLGDDFDPLQDAINEFVFATTQDDGSTVLSVDTTGSGNASLATQFATLQGVTTSIEELNNQGSFVTA
ncbi:MAG: type I secretion C-terminal target domain-containing protein, partial [Alphaproteobacteria bacterium]|nr:type I secretion C-terminal target domain-containing protein [Alphaproteobacteria bacterium]